MKSIGRRFCTIRSDALLRWIWRGLLISVSSAITSHALAHPGSVDENGGHYNGASYHCHMSLCEQPDTFNRSGRDSFFFDPSSRDKFYNVDDWPYDEDFDGDCQNTRHEILVATSRAPVRYTNPRNCEVRTGEWFDEYTGKTFNVAARASVVPRAICHGTSTSATM